VYGLLVKPNPTTLPHPIAIRALPTNAVSNNIHTDLTGSLDLHDDDDDDRSDGTHHDEDDTSPSRPSLTVPHVSMTIPSLPFISQPASPMFQASNSHLLFHPDSLSALPSPTLLSPTQMPYTAHDLPSPPLFPPVLPSPQEIMHRFMMQSMQAAMMQQHQQQQQQMMQQQQQQQPSPLVVPVVKKTRAAPQRKKPAVAPMSVPALPKKKRVRIGVRTQPVEDIESKLRKLKTSTCIGLTSFVFGGRLIRDVPIVIPTVHRYPLPVDE
jgi:hypothetical protein